MLETILNRLAPKIMMFSIEYKKLRLEKTKFLNEVRYKEPYDKDINTQLFYELNNIELTSKNLKNLENDDNVIFIKKYLRKYPKILKYENSKLSYIRDNQEEINKKADLALKIIFGFLLMLSFLPLFIFQNFTSLLSPFVITIYVIYMSNNMSEFNEIDKLIKSYE